MRRCSPAASASGIQPLAGAAAPAAALLVSPAFAADPAPVVAAERAFAADGAAHGVKASFLRWSAPDAVVFAPEPVNAQAFYSARADAGPKLAWRPIWAGLAQSGDLGFTTGPYSRDGKPAGHYFTVWARQPDGGWKWIYDGGVENDASQAPPPAAPVAVLPPPQPRPARADEAMIAVGRAEAELARAAAENVGAAYREFLAPDARLQGSPAAPAATSAARAEELATRPARIGFTRLGGRAAGSGDLVWTYGQASWTGGRGHYVRIWQRRDRWRLVFDQLLAAPPPKP